MKNPNLSTPPPPRKKIKINTRSVIISLFSICLLSFLIIACSKENEPAIDNNEVLLYKNVESKNILNPSSINLGGNTKEVTQISYNNSILDNLKKSEVWKNILKTYTLNVSEIKRTYFFNTSKASLVTIPIISSEGESYFNIFFQLINF